MHSGRKEEDEETRNPKQPAKSPKEEQQSQQRNWPKRLKKTYRALQGSPLVHSKGEGSQPTSQPAQLDEEETPIGSMESNQIQPEEEEEEEEEYRPWIRKPFDVVLNSLSTIKGQYMAINKVLVDINKTLGVPSLAIADHIKMLPKKREMEDLQAQIKCLVKEAS